MIAKRMYLMLVWPPVENKIHVKNQNNYSTNRNGGQQLFVQETMKYIRETQKILFSTHTAY
jgi:hypothetical protein